MKLIPLKIEGAWLAESPVWSDERGTFREWFKREEVLSMTGIDFSVKQANMSVSQRGVIRGIHYSLAPEGQSKWVTCVQGSILDVIVDIRPKSPTFKKYEIVELGGIGGRALLIGAGLGHGFLSLENNTVTSYLLSSEYNVDLEHGVNFFDKDLDIEISHKWDSIEPLRSEKDSLALGLMDLRKLNLLPEYNPFQFRR
jgi:dTDP-4-dehydrorhamnose 3,5-epimerase